MKLNGILKATAAVAATALVAGGVMVTMVGIDRPAEADPQFGNEQAETEAPVAGDSTVASNDVGTEQYRGGGAHGGGAHAGGFHGVAAHGGFAHGGYGHTGWGRGGYGHAGWGGHGWGGSRWGRWGGGRYVGGRWVAGPYWGWCDGRYYACNRYYW